MQIVARTAGESAVQVLDSCFASRDGAFRLDVSASDAPVLVRSTWREVLSVGVFDFQRTLATGRTVTTEVILSNDHGRSLEIPLDTGWQLRVTVVDSSRSPVDGAVVQLESILRRHSKRGGLASFRDLPAVPEPMRLECSAKGFESRALEVISLEEPGVLDVEVRLQESRSTD